MAAEPFDVLIVGSGAGGGMAAYELTRRGLKVLLLEAGRDYDPADETPMFNLPAEAPLRGEPTPDKPMGYYDATVGGGWDIPDEPYTVAEGSEPFKWWRPRMLGGRTNHWGRVSLRFGPYDFKPHSRDGLGFDWPVTYDEIAPWYDKVEKLIGVSGGPAQGFENTPDSPEGCLQPAPPPKPYELLVGRAFASMGIPTAPTRAAILTQPLGERQACFYATPCIRGCSIGAAFQSTTGLLPQARATGNLTIRTDAMVYQVDLDSAGKASGVSFIDRSTRQHHNAKAKAVVLSAGAGETARILMNSRGGGFRNGIGNDYGLVGRYLMDTVGTKVTGQIPALEGLPVTNDDGMSIMHTYVPWWGYQAQARGELNFPRGYHVEMNGGRLMPSMNLIDWLDDGKGLVGPELRASMRQRYGSTIRLGSRGEMIPNDDCYCDLDPKVKDKWGVPVLRFHWKWGEPEIAQATHAMATFLEVIDRMGGTPVPPFERDGRKAISKGGEIIHEVGTARMGADAKTSVVDSFGRSWAVRNLFVADGAVMVSSPDKNPTLSILALSWRTASHLADLAQRGEL
ncbi:GMC family oxidoreductase [Sphingomonas sp. MG17]|uniref:GMC family oxidoreductase n=1 Tax=Sphingomonas tagetis TaxID=2949092 RepID=A0A9X2HH16_9SPHN|nr:GMC family oxidoreductase [Sphingomonas tagetis]MCP3731011.1 GMC family oxidoreductase [Sphingomonas tagetis]